MTMSSLIQTVPQLCASFQNKPSSYRIDSRPSRNQVRNIRKKLNWTIGGRSSYAGSALDMASLIESIVQKTTAANAKSNSNTAAVVVVTATTMERNAAHQNFAQSGNSATRTTVSHMDLILMMITQAKIAGTIALVTEMMQRLMTARGGQRPLCMSPLMVWEDT